MSSSVSASPSASASASTSQSPSQYIYGYVAASLASVGNLDDSIELGKQNSTLQNLQQVYSDIEKKLSSVAYKDRAWESSIAVQDGKPVMVLGLIHDQSTPRPRLPDNLTKIYSGQQAVDLPQKYPKHG